ncbi:MAG: bifunctional DNA-formamidopyrimidine glycosylase/DNA-(apurinic or apyrimidinic site) lyase [Deltaproteobacteria bacterium]|nr:bifunctional DNA-formamidopyrimidine glycosylase/DNA-(apurinic or apyrimidinic site) lyase [Kofleriaceae bacterium]
MPELPEVESVRRDLVRRRLRGATVVRVRGSGKPLRMNKPVPMAALGRAARGRRIVDVKRLGKYLMIELDGPASVLVHLGMTGNLLVVPRRTPWAPHTHVVFELDDGRDLRFVDPRRFGMVDTVARGREREHVALAGLGPDPIAEGIPASHLWDRARGKACKVKPFILDQRVVAGVGNIYASEVLWLARISPRRKAGRLGADDARAVSVAIDHVLRFAIDNGGTTLRDFVDAGGEPGENGEYLLVYGRDGHPCPRCRTKIRRQVDQGRATYFCPTCQKR